MNKWLLTVLAVLVVIGLAFALSRRQGPVEGSPQVEAPPPAALPEAPAPPSAEPPQTSAPPPDELQAPDQTGAQPAAIHETAYAFLAQFGQEKEGYGLYSYVLFPHPSARARAFAETLFATTGAAAESLIAPESINILYLPTHELEADLPSSRSAGGPAALANLIVDRAYNYALARALMARICSAPAEPVADLCAGDLSRGPYLFTYARPLSNLSPVPPPYLFVDLSPVHERAFSEFIAAYKAQVKRTDYTDRERIETFRLRLLSIVLTAADWVGPAGTAVADILHMADRP